ncbi:MAG TPA: DNA mismatch repair endonuclease MutL [Bacteroidales bacterium]|nr:DNA mismatch repair endonuclease MutL [Bacteroidales bacterium]
MADIIRLLPDSVANQIAAGEVIQRPASVVKELMENSVDAGADNIELIIRDSGKTLIQVIDNGTGMSETDARLSFERHATSKISSANDLFAIKTKGFRGEALASIAAVSMVELRTRKADTDEGTLIIINGSKVEAQEPCSCMPGSCFSIKNLFFNIPARRKFLKSDNTEMRHIVIEFQKIALAHPEIRFQLLHNNDVIYSLPAGNRRQRIVGVFGRQMGNDLIPLDTSTNLVNVSGYVGKPENARRTYGEQFFFVNNRFMKHPYFHRAVTEACQNILPAETIPSYFIFMEVDAASIDINIHPTKTEIKFEDERTIWQILMASVKEALGRFNIVPSIDFSSEMLIDIPVSTIPGNTPVPPEIAINRQYDPFAGENSVSHKQQFIHNFEKEHHAHWEKLFPPADLPGRKSPHTEGERRFFQLGGKYIACPVKSGLMIIDQKRAHERILFEKILKNKGPANLSQALMFPVSINLNPADYFLIREIEEDLQKTGFRFRLADPDMIIITGLPAGLNISDPAPMLEQFLEEYKNSPADPSEGTRNKVAAALAAASSIPYGRILFKDEMEDMFDTLFACSSPNFTPLGKPVLSIIDLAEIEQRLK